MIRTPDRVIGGNPNAARLADRLNLPPAKAWEEQAVCRQSDPELFFAEGPGSVWATNLAKSVCARCPVKVECLQDALDNDERYGVRGGLSERERRKLARPNATHPCDWPGCHRGFGNASALATHRTAHRREETA